MLKRLAKSHWLLLLLSSWGREPGFVSGAETEPAAVRQVAIVGAGAAGSSAAFHLSRLAGQDDSPVRVNVTVFERSARIGGRTLTVDVHDDPAMPLELGASIFVEVNSIMCGAVKEFGLPLESFDEGVMAVWDGQNFVYEQDDNSPWWWNIGRMFWKYGLSPYRAQSLMKSTVATFLSMYEAPHFPFRSLSRTVFDLGLEKSTAVTGQQLLRTNSISDGFGRDIVQAATRVNYASDLADIHGLETMVSIAANGAMTVRGGNWQVFASMLQSSNATSAVLRETAVSSISPKAEEEGRANGPARYILSTHPTSEASAAAEEEYPVAFDSVIIAAPWQYANITAGHGLLSDPIDEIPFTLLHVTLFTSPFALSPEFFGLQPGTNVPRVVLTTTSPDGETRPDFFSISTVGEFPNPRTGDNELAYKIFSPQAVTPAFLSSLLGAPVPETFTQHEDAAEPISWYFPHIFHSYPVLHPRVTFQDPVLGDALYYTSGIESFISTMETSALMGKNVAHLVFRDLVAGRETSDDGAIKDLRRDQKVLGTEFRDMNGTPAEDL